ncbi:hypothetical protein V502_07321 [Pseudogymnoascus sp. VKM F-4520 (FW-2644)]|nr:hypothetical protein V502_07321 [Pseudogymnoascus sp. VKM F-4520 (FW-2644)]
MPNKTADYQGPFLQKIFNISANLTPLFLSARLPVCPTHPRSASSLHDPPILLFSPGYSIPRLYYNVLASAIASEGFTVITMDHPGDANIITYPSGYSVYNNDTIQSTAAMVSQIPLRAADASFVINQLRNATAIAELLPQRGPRPFPTDRVAMLGHSLGGVSAVLAASQDPRLRGAINWDGTFLEFPSPLSQPVLLMSHGMADASWPAAWPLLKGPKLWVNVANTTHETFSDVPTLLQAAGQDTTALAGLLGTIDPGEMVRILVAYTTAWMEGLFRGEEGGPLLEGQEPVKRKLYVPNGLAIPAGERRQNVMGNSLYVLHAVPSTSLAPFRMSLNTLVARAGRAYVEELERRVEEMEQQLQRQPGSQMDLKSTLPSSAPASPNIPDRSESSESGDVENQNTHESVGFTKNDHDGPDSEGSRIDQASYIIHAQDGNMRYFGSSSGLPVGSLQGANWLKSQTGTAALHTTTHRCAGRWQLNSWLPRTLQDSFERRISQPLPCKSLAVELVREFFETFNKAIPLFNETSFMRLFKRQFSWNPEESPSWWVSFNIVLAFAYRERAQESSVGSEDWERSLGHVKNALNVVVELFMRNGDLLAVQGLLGLAIYFQGTPNPQALFMFAAAAMRLSHSIGLHRSSILGLSESQIEDRRRTYWIAFILDADISLRVGRPLVQDINDYDTPFPAKHPQDGNGVFSVDDTQIHYFRLLAQFALIQRRVYQHLYAVAVHKQARDSVLKEVKACEEALLRWKASIPAKLQPQNTFSAKPHYFLQHILRLHYAYHCCYSNLHQVCMFTRQPVGSTSIRGIPTVENKIAQTLAGSLESARSAIRLLKHVRGFGSSYRWDILYFVAAASVTLASRILVYPSSPRAEEDLSLIHETNDFLSKISSDEPGTFADYVLGISSDLEDAGRKTVDQLHQGYRQQQEGGAHSNSADIFADENRDKHSGSGMDPTTSTTLLDRVSTTTPQNTDHMGNSMDAPIQGGSLPTIDLPSDLMMNWQWSIPPFWNLQDIMTSTPPSPLPDVISGQEPKDAIFEF